MLAFWAAVANVCVKGSRAGSDEEVKAARRMSWDVSSEDMCVGLEEGCRWAAVRGRWEMRVEASKGRRGCGYFIFILGWGRWSGR